MTRLRSLNQLRGLRQALLGLRRGWLVHGRGLAVHPGASVSLSACFIPGARGAISVGDGTMIAFKTLFLAQHPDGSVAPIRVGRDCFIGGGALILPGVTIGDGSVVAAGAVVAGDVAPGCLVAGNPARVLRERIGAGRYGRFAIADTNEQRLHRLD